VRPGPRHRRPSPFDRAKERLRNAHTNDQQTRERLLEVATRLFGAVGFAHATIRDISREARANVAAVNYHFRDKIGLYREVLEAAFDAIRETTERAKAAGEGKSAEEKLEAYIRVHCEVILTTSDPSVIQQLIHQELQQPTAGIVDRLIDRTMKPRFEYLYAVIGELLDLPPDDERVRLTAITIHGVILMFRPNPIMRKFGTRLKLEFTPEQITEHVIKFSLAAVKAYKR
jgi:TetR/AcrR family transcriptional regulator, regulator of cefoperazone and chloramphenicol sensitivity